MSRDVSDSPWAAALKRYPALTEYLWERSEEEECRSMSTDEIGEIIGSIGETVAQILEDDLRSGVFTPHFQRTVRTAWSDIEQRFVLTSDQGC